MLPRTHINPEDHWVAEPDLPYSQAVRCGEMIFVTGQVDFDRDWNVSCPGDLSGQAAAAVNALSPACWSMPDVTSPISPR